MLGDDKNDIHKPTPGGSTQYLFRKDRREIFIMKNTWLAVAILALPSPVGAFTTANRSGVSTAVVPFRLMSYSAPGGWDDTSNGGWDNDDYLNSLGGSGNGEAMNEGYYDQQEQRVVPENDMTDEEITMMAMRAAQYYNTDASIEEVYGVPRQGPPSRMDEGEFQ